jgi:hypothetical protein
LGRVIVVAAAAFVPAPAADATAVVDVGYIHMIVYNYLTIDIRMFNIVAVLTLGTLINV